jgi:DNA-binding transcriptional ArsR family regulator
MEYSEALAHKIEARITELKTEIDAHERALAALRGRSGAASSNATASNGRRRGAAKRTRAAATKSDGATAKSAGAGNRDGTAAGRPRRARRTRSASASAEAVFDALKEGQDQASAIAKQFGVSPAVVRNRLSQLEEAGRVSRTGNRRSTRWRSHAA